VIIVKSFGSARGLDYSWIVGGTSIKLLCVHFLYLYLFIFVFCIYLLHSDSTSESVYHRFWSGCSSREKEANEKAYIIQSLPYCVFFSASVFSLAFSLHAMKLWSLFYEIENDFSHYSSSYYFCFYFEMVLIVSLMCGWL